MRRRNQAFTLVELMIAVALMVILTGSIVFVFTQAQKVYSRTDASVRVYQNARQALDIMEKDVANAYKSMDLEFWGPDRKDPMSQDFNGHLDLNAELPSFWSSPDWDPNIPNTKRDIKNYRIEDVAGVSYFYSMGFKEGQWTDALGVNHFADEFFFKTETPIKFGSGAAGTRTALVKYGLSVDPNGNRQPILMKWIAWLDKSGATPKLKLETAQALCYHVADFRVELYIRNKRSNRPGKFYSIKDALALGAAGNMGSTLGGKKIFTPLFLGESTNGGTSGPVNNNGYTMSGNAQFNRLAASEPFLSIPSAASSGNGNKTDPKCIFLYQLDKGDKMFIYNSQKVGTNNYAIPAGEYTIKDIRFDQNQWKVYFREAIDTSQMDSGGLATTPVSFRASWVPSAVRITIKVTDGRKKATADQVSRTIVRVYKILGS